ncbi:hypothetical protein SEA_LONEWOLF_33 [Mycobacterium phage LoneWolf]|nr:hypothetical protein SEA_LONEWOLF_33 [Mycobacterium phage LoneWolf]
MQRIGDLSTRERERILRDLEIEHRSAVVDAAKIRRSIRDLQGQLQAKEQRVREIEDGIAILRPT